MKFEVGYYDQQLKDEIMAWPADLYADYLRLLGLVEEFGPILRMPHSRAMGDGMFELRPRGRSGIGRAFYCYLLGRRVIIIHAFIKKTQKTPEREITIARNRVKKVKK
ncbi:MAG TPA: type II toxin-antitoxin system RelE/ParE family toxin [Pyrinomonadaceae bacterium]|nr:type II toxin-antitoxin system RelE/ParE family toxin [Acidobacteriota bacterium]HQZ97242.1 type II toxin-antitoxin system RelE/ParE family toxin [Pyrinomonadaceae bacterium]